MKPFRELSKRSRSGLYAALIVLLAGVAIYAVDRVRRSREPSFRIQPMVPANYSPELNYRTKPNLFVILVDTLRADHLGAYGYDRPTSPAIDRLAAEGGILFEHAYSVAPWTNPAIATLFTGKYPQTVFAPAPHHVAITRALPKNIETLAEVVKKAGYRTVALVDHPGINARLGFSRGFDEFHDLYLEGGAGYWTRTNPVFVLDAFKTATANVGRKDAPLFLYLHLVYPHRPYVPAKRYARLFGSGFTNVEEGQKEGVINMYDAEIRQTDELLGNMFAEMKARGWYDETAIVFTSDHGEAFWEHGLEEHGASFFDEEIRIPLIVAPPGGRTTEPERVRHPVSSVGLFATVLDLAGITPSRGVHGLSLLRFFTATDTAEAETLDWFFSESPHSDDIHAAAVLSSRGEKYILYQNPSVFPEEMLFDLTADPLEHENVAPDSPRLKAYRSLLREHWEMNRIARTANEQETVDVDPETLERLRALGYIN